LLAFRGGFCYQVTPRNISQGGIGMNYPGWLFADFYFWYGRFFGWPGRGEVC
jgi:hypothetical protein